MEFNEEQLAAIQQMIAEKVAEATTAQADELDRLRTHNSTLIGENRAKVQAAKDARDAAEAAAREKMEKENDIESARSLLSTTEATVSDLRKKLKEINFDNAILSAVTTRNIHADVREDLVDALRFRAQYDEEKSETTINGESLDRYLDTLLASDKGKRYIPASAATGAGAPGSISNKVSSGMTKETFNADKFYAMPKADRDNWADQNEMPFLKNVP